MVDRTMKGLYPIMSMPFDSQGRIDVEDLQRETEFAIEAGVHGLGIALATEVPKLSGAERDLATKTVVEQANGRVNVVVNTGAPGTDVTIQNSQHAQDLGVDAVMIMPPPANLAGPVQIREYYHRISDAIDVPIFMQDVGSAPVPPSLAAEIARESEKACYVKAEVIPTPPRIAQAVKLGAPDLIVFGGAGGNMLVEELRRGSVGTMPPCAYPELFRKVWDLFQEGKEDEAVREHNRFLPLSKTLSQGSALSSHRLTKEVLRLRGVFKEAYVRHPYIPPEDLTLREVRDLVESLELKPV